MSFDYCKLSGRIVEKCGTQTRFAQLMGLSARSVSLKMNNKVGWRQDEIQNACRVLDLKATDIPAYFFAT